jgi:hypothetical protein
MLLMVAASVASSSAGWRTGTRSDGFSAESRFAVLEIVRMGAQYPPGYQPAEPLGSRAGSTRFRT